MGDETEQRKERREVPDWREVWHWWNAYDEPYSSEEMTYRERNLETQYTCSKAAGTLLRLAESAASQEFHIYFYLEEPDIYFYLEEPDIYFYLEEPGESGHYDVVSEEMRHAAAGLTGRDRGLLKQVARAAFVAAASIDPHANYQTWERDSGCDPNPHHYYRILSGLLWAILTEKATEPRQHAATHEERGEG